MISGDRALAAGVRGAFHSTLEVFRRHWDRIDVLCPFATDSSSTESEPFDNVRVHQGPRPIGLHWRWIARKGGELVARHRHELMTVHEYPPFYNGFGAWLLHRSTGIPYVLEIHHVPGHPRPANARERLDRLAARWLLRFDARLARAVRVVNEHEVPGFLRAAGVPDQKVVCIPSLYIDHSVFRPMDLPKSHDLIFVGRLVPNKGIDLLLDAVTTAPLRLAIVGDGPLRSRIEAEIHDRKLEERVTMSGWLPSAGDVAELINRSRVLAMTSYNEGGPRVLVEALACGVPVLATRVGIAPELVARHRCGLLVDWDASDVARKARALLDDPAELGAMGRRGIDLSREFERERTVRRYAEALHELASTRGS